MDSAAPAGASAPSKTDGRADFRPCVVVPVYNHRATLRATAAAISAHALPCIFVDDGSTDGSREELERICADTPQCSLLVREENGGKGAALSDGFRAAIDRGFTHAVQIDADGQHNPDDIPRFLDAARSRPSALIIGEPIFDDSAPLARIWGRKISNVLGRLQTMRLFGSDAPHDVLCGFRVYPLEGSAAIIAAASGRVLSPRRNSAIQSDSSPSAITVSPLAGRDCAVSGRGLPCSAWT